MLSEAKLHSRINFDGLDISVEVPAGGYRRGTNKKTGEEWAVKVPASYGYIKGTHSPDGEHLDCYVRRNPKRNAKVYVMHQLTVDGTRFDEDKVMIGYSSKAEAIKAFKDVTFKSVMYGGCTEFDMETFQIIAYSASKSTAMLTDNKTYQIFKKRGLLQAGIKSPLDVARKVSESLSQGLSNISDTLYKGDLVECLDWGGIAEDLPVETIMRRAWGHYLSCDYMQEMGQLSESEFREAALSYMMEIDSLLTDVEDFYEQEQIPDNISDINENIDDLEDSIGDTSINQIEEVMEDFPMSNEKYVVVVHTQIMENIGSPNAPSWATAGTKTQLVDEGFASYGEARAIAAKVSAGIIPVEIKEGSFVLGIDVITEGEYRQFHEDENAEQADDDAVEENTTNDVFFAQQIQETTKLAGVRAGTYENKGTPTVHETRTRLEALTQAFYEGIAEEEEDEIVDESTSLTLSPAKLDEALRTVRATVVKNPKHTIGNIIRAVCEKKYGNVNLDEAVIQHAESQYGSLENFNKECRGSLPTAI